MPFLGEVCANYGFLTEELIIFHGIDKIIKEEKQ